MIEKNQYGYIKQKGNRYFCGNGVTTHFNSGFKTLKQFNEWIEEEFKKHGLDWRVGYAWKYRDNETIFRLLKSNGKEVEIK